MKIKLTVHLDVEDQKLLQFGDFTVRKEEDIPGTAYEWICEIKKETGYRDTCINKVIVNNEKDITEEVREIDEEPIPDIDFGN
ncbi:hypothetical protein [Bacillus methanolicus]|uniref:Uncharacterized protein n=1 Tax=Bacillus methanolicus (strain MGA3 / ATCC 53907) TaxID=796606 RepID=I3DTG9_BACMM|nr:hypothetical protein [Bacillus methanolicus]AIE61732.1 hypothetical protein BMMGA3_16915 [Bacillus methanolicus MGA3]EIJ77540.1 hypothetical protein MGA3_17622 [Bacillus methanolicus MGA3]